MTPPDTPDETAALADAIALLQTELNRLDRLTAATLQIGSAEDLQVLRLLLSDGSLRVGELAGRRCTSVATVSARLDRLERRGLVVRQRLPGDRRAVVATLTEAGRAAAAASADQRRRALTELEAAIDPEVVTAVAACLRDADGPNSP